MAKLPFLDQDVRNQWGSFQSQVHGHPFIVGCIGELVAAY